MIVSPLRLRDIDHSRAPERWLAKVNHFMLNTHFDPELVTLHATTPVVSVVKVPALWSLVTQQQTTRLLTPCSEVTMYHLIFKLAFFCHEEKSSFHRGVAAMFTIKGRNSRVGTGNLTVERL